MTFYDQKGHGKLGTNPPMQLHLLYYLLFQLTGNHIFFLNRKKHHFLILIWKSANKVILPVLSSGV